MKNNHFDTEFCLVIIYILYSVCNFQAMKSPMELNSLLSKFFCYITWLVISPDQTRQCTTCKRGLYIKSYCFFEALAHWFKNYKLYFKIFTGLHVCLEQPCAQHLFSIIMQNKAQHEKEHLNRFEEKKCLFSVCFIYLKYFKNVRIKECINK